MNKALSKTFTELEIKQKLCRHYGDTPDRRNMIKCKHEDEHNGVGTVFYSVVGSPPKGYAIYVKRRHMLSMYDGHGKRFKIYRNVDIEGVDV